MEAVALLLALGGAWAAIRGVRLFVRGYRDADHPSASLRVIRGIRGLVVAVGTWALAGGLLFGQTWLLVFGAVFLAEELYETGVVALILRAGARASRAEQALRPGASSRRQVWRSPTAAERASSSARHEAGAATGRTTNLEKPTAMKRSMS